MAASGALSSLSKILVIDQAAARQAVITGTSAVEAFFYSSLQAGARHASSLTFRVQQFFRDHAIEIQGIFTSLDEVSVLYEAHTLIEEFKKFAPKNPLSLATSGWVGKGSAVLLTTAAAAALGHLIAKHLSPAPSPAEELHSEEDLANNIRSKQKYRKLLLGAKLATSSALLLFSANRLQHLITAALSLYSLQKVGELSQNSSAPASWEGNSFSVLSMDYDHPRYPTTETDRFHDIHTAYTAVQAGLSSLLFYPHFARVAFYIQQLFIPVDIVFLSLGSALLYNALQKRIRPQNQKAFAVLFIIGTVAAGVFTYYALVQFNAYRLSAVLLQQTVAKLSLPADVLATTTVSWDPAIATQWFYTTRIVITAALSFFASKQHKRLAALSICAQSFSLSAISQLHWIKWVQTFRTPLAKILQEGGSVSGTLTADSISAMKVEMSFQVASSCSTNPEHLHETLQSISSYALSIFNKSSWQRFWEHVRRVHFIVGNQVITRTFITRYPVTDDPFQVRKGSLVYAFTPSPWRKKLPLLTTTQTPQLSSLTINVIDKWFGNAAVRTYY